MTRSAVWDGSSATCPSCFTTVASETRDTDGGRYLRSVYAHPVRVRRAETPGGPECWGLRAKARKGWEAIRPGVDTTEALRGAAKRDDAGSVIESWQVSDYQGMLPDPCETWCPACRARVIVAMPSR